MATDPLTPDATTAPHPLDQPVISSAGDARDQRWLDDQVDKIEDGINAVIEIAHNWTDGRNLARLHPGVSAKDYILACVQRPLGRAAVVPLLEQSDWSNRQIAEVAGVSHQTVGRVRAQVVHVDQLPDETLGADGRYRSVTVLTRDPEPPPKPITVTIASVPDHLSTPRSGSARDRVERLTRQYLNAVTQLVNQSPPLRSQYRLALDALEGAMRPSEIHQARLEVGRAERNLARAEASARTIALPEGAVTTEVRAAGWRLERARERLAAFNEP